MDKTRTEMLIGSVAVNKLANSSVAVFGLGGVGSYVAESLARLGVGSITVVDNDVISASNVNRQLYALQSTLGSNKTDVAKERILDINPSCNVTAMSVRFDNTTVGNFDFSKYDYVADCIDTVSSKLLLVECCFKCNTPIISCMGTGNKLNPTLFKVADIYDTSICPLARVMRRELKARNIDKLKVVYSTEEPVKTTATENGKPIPSSISFVPSVAGLIITSEIFKDITNGLD